MKLNANQIIELTGVLSSIATKEFDFNTSCIIAKNIKEIEPAYKVVNDKRDAIIMKYGEKDSNGELDTENGIKIKAEYVDDFNKEITTLLSSETEIDLKMISKDSMASISISPSSILALEPILK